MITAHIIYQVCIGTSIELLLQIFCRILVSQPMVYLQLLYAVLCLLPLGWLLGLLAPLDALLPWLMEQTLVHLIGGSPLATDLRYKN